MENNSPQKTRSFTLATLLFVISLFPAGFAWKLSKEPDALTFLFIYFSIVISSIIASVARHLLFGVSVSDE